MSESPIKDALAREGGGFLVQLLRGAARGAGEQGRAFAASDQAKMTRAVLTLADAASGGVLSGGAEIGRAFLCGEITRPEAVAALEKLGAGSGDAQLRAVLELLAQPPAR